MEGELLKIQYVFIFLLIFVFCFNLSADSSNQANVIKKCINPKYTYSIVLPSSYDKFPDKKFPVVFISSPGGTPYTMGLSEWAEDNNVILVLNRATRNGAEEEYTAAIQSLVKTIESNYRIHPYLRFSIGFSGGGEASAHMSITFPKQWAGVIMMAHSGNYRYPPKHCAVAFLAGEKDNVHPLSFIKETASKLKIAGNPVHLKVYPDRGHQAAPAEDIITELNWMLKIKRYNHPYIDKDYVKVLDPEVDEKIKAITDEENIEEQVEHLKEFLDYSWIKYYHNYDKLKLQYLKGVLKLSTKTSEPVVSWGILLETRYSKDFKAFDRKFQYKVMTCINNLEKKPELQKEKLPMKKFFKANKELQKYLKGKRLSGRKKKSILKQFSAIISKYPDTLAAKKSEESKKILLQ